MRVIEFFQLHSEARINSHKNARLTARGRAHLIEQITLLGFEEAARRAGISSRRARIWQQRATEENQNTLTDCSSMPHVCPCTTPAGKRSRIVNLRPSWRGQIATTTRDTLLSSTPGELLHLDTKQRAGFSLILADEMARSAITFALTALRYDKALGVRVTASQQTTDRPIAQRNSPNCSSA